MPRATAFIRMFAVATYLFASGHWHAQPAEAGATTAISSDDASVALVRAVLDFHSARTRCLAIEAAKPEYRRAKESLDALETSYRKLESLTHNVEPRREKDEEQLSKLLSKVIDARVVVRQMEVQQQNIDAGVLVARARLHEAIERYDRSPQAVQKELAGHSFDFVKVTCGPVLYEDEDAENIQTDETKVAHVLIRESSAHQRHGADAATKPSAATRGSAATCSVLVVWLRHMEVFRAVEVELPRGLVVGKTEG